MKKLSKRTDLVDEMQVTICGKPWTIKFVTRRNMPRNTWGDCTYDKSGGGTIRVRKDLSAVNFLDTLIHELRHAQHPVLFEAEEFVDKTSTEIAEILLMTRRIFVNHGAKSPRSARSNADY